MKYNKNLKGQMSEAIITAAFLTMSGGFQDAYTYCLRGGVFANAQTGNIVLMSSYLFKNDFISASHYLIPLFAFASGIFTAEIIHRRYKHMETMHWRQLILLAEILLLFAVGFIPRGINIPANAVVSFVCAMQVQSFRKFNGKSYASTMCIGNIRSGTEALCAYFHTRDKNILKSSLEYFYIIFMFAAGAGIGSILTYIFKAKAIWFACILLAISFCLMMGSKSD